MSDREILITITVCLSTYIEEDERNGWTDKEIIDHAVKEVERVLGEAQPFSLHSERWRTKRRLSSLGYIVDDVFLTEED